VNKKPKSKYMKFKELYLKHGLPFVCRELDITADEYNKFRTKALSHG
jgi:hypothetical protein